MTTPPTYTELRRLLAEATPGPWTEHFSGSTYFIGDPSGLGPAADIAEHADAALIAAMRNALPGLLRNAEAGWKLRVAVGNAVAYSKHTLGETVVALADYDREVGT